MNWCPRLLLLLDDPEVSGDDLADVIRVDPGLTADILHVANSAVFARGSAVETVTEAVNRLGLREIYRTLMRIIASPVLANEQQSGFARLDLWKHSISSALAAQILAKRLGIVEPDLAFTVSLLHDVGKVVLSQTAGPGYIELIDETKAAQAELHKNERKAYGTDHAEAGAKLLKEWNFPQRIITAVAFHHSPETAGPVHAPLAATVYAANILAYRVGSGYGFPQYTALPDPDSLRPLNLEAAELFAFEGDLGEALEQEQMRLTS